jgi:hypothetical protein
MKPTARTNTPEKPDLLRLAAETCADVRSVRRAYEGGAMNPAIFKAVADAATKLGLLAPKARK